MASPSSLYRWLLAAVCLALAGCGGGPSEPRPRNVLLVSIDTLRADHLGCYGYERDTSPRLDALAAQALRYAHVVAPAPWTLPSHAGLLTGRHPFELGVTEQKSRLPEDVPTLAERLHEAGFQSAAFVDSSPGGFLGGRRGFERGFGRYEHAPHVPRGPAGPGSPYRYDAAGTVDAGLRWLEARDPERPFFLFLHTKSVHTAPADRRLLAESDVPYHKPLAVRGRFLPGGHERFRWTDADGAAGVAWLKAANRRIEAGELDPASFPPDRLEELIGLYDAGIWYTDRELGRLLDELERLGLADDTLVVITADHGEAFLEQRTFLHKDVYGSVLRVPLIVRDPSLAPERARSVIEAPVSLVDVAPTILERLGLESGRAGALDGVPLPLSDDEARARGPRALFSSTAGGLSQGSSLEEDGWKLVLQRSGDGRRGELYRPEDDPLDRHPLDDPERLAAMARRLEQWLGTAREGASELELDDETLEDLRKLGYGD